jgi:amino acid permease
MQRTYSENVFALNFSQILTVVGLVVLTAVIMMNLLCNPM